MKKKELLKTRQYKQSLDKGLYLNNVPTSWCVRFNLSAQDLLIFCVIRDATERGELRAYTGSVKGLCAKVNCTLPTARRSLQKLNEKGFIEKRFRRRGDKNIITYEANVTTHTSIGGLPIEEILEIKLIQRKTVGLI